jgi:hypothetical protein
MISSECGLNTSPIKEVSRRPGHTTSLPISSSGLFKLLTLTLDAELDSSVREVDIGDSRRWKMPTKDVRKI